MELKDFRLVEVQWVDSYGVTSSWGDIDEVIDESSHTTIHSVGWIIKEREEDIVLAPNFCTKTNNVCGVMVIPRVSIKKQINLTIIDLDS
jgi:hypothetical protein